MSVPPARSDYLSSYTLHVKLLPHTDLLEDQSSFEFSQNRTRPQCWPNIGQSLDYGLDNN